MQKTSSLISLAVAIAVLASCYFQWWQVKNEGNIELRKWVKILFAFSAVVLIIAFILLVFGE